MTYLEKRREERRAWYAAYLAASDDEKTRMMEERKKELAIEEENRQKRIYDDRKARFVKKCDEQIAALESLMKFEKVTLEIIKNFDGKVLNARLTNAVDAEVKKIEKYSYATLKYDYSYDNGTRTTFGKLTISLSYFHGWYKDFSVKIFYNEEGRINAEKTLEGYESCLARLISDWKKVRKDYDKIHKKAMKVKKEIEAYRKESVYLRDFLRSEGIIGYTSDL